MSILKANLRHLHQRHSLWLAYFVFGCLIFASIAIPLDRPRAGEGLFIGLIALAFLIGVFAVMLQMEILTKPFALCLPSHRQTVRKFIFSIGIVTNLIGSMLFLFYPGLHPLWRVLVICSAFFAGLTFYLVSAWLSFRSRQPLALIGFLFLPVMASQFLNLHILLERAIIFHPLMTSAIGLLCSAALWFYLNDYNLARINCQAPWIGFAEIFNREKLRKFQQTKRGANLFKQLKDHPRPWIEDIFINRMSRKDSCSRARFIWGGLYTSYGVLISQWRNLLPFALIMALVMGYMNPRMWIVMAFAPVMLLAKSRPNLYSNMLTTSGRHERFCSTLAVVCAAGVLLTVFFALIALMSIPLDAMIPDIEYHGLKLAYNVISLKGLYAPLALLPLAYAILLVLYRKPVLMIVALATLFYATMIINIIWHKEISDLYGIGTFTATAILSWIIFVLVLRHVCTKRCLTK